jgi:hypothetical protein
VFFLTHFRLYSLFLVRLLACDLPMVCSKVLWLMLLFLWECETVGDILIPANVRLLVLLLLVVCPVVSDMLIYDGFFSAATLVAADYGFTCPPRFMSVCCVLGRMKIAISQPYAVRLSWNLVETCGWYPRLACMFWFQGLIILYIVNKQKNKKTVKITKITVLQNLRFLCRSKSNWSETWWGHPYKY